MSDHSDDSPLDTRELLAMFEATLGKRDRLLGDIARLDGRFNLPLSALERHGPKRSVRAPPHSLKRHIEKHTPLDHNTPTDRAHAVQGAVIALALPPSKITHATLTWAIDLIQRREHTNLEEALDHLFDVTPEALFDELGDAIHDAIAPSRDAAPPLWHRARFRIAWAHRFDEPERLIEELERGVRGRVDDPEELFDELLLQRLDKRLRNLLLPLVIDAVDFTRARTLLDKMGAHDHALLLDGLATIILDAPIHATRVAAIEACVRIANPRAQDALVAVLGDPGTGIRRAACEALGVLGTPRALHALGRHSEFWNTRQMRRDCEAAIEAILTRHPDASASQDEWAHTEGALTLTHHDARPGALSTTGIASQGALSTPDTNTTLAIADAQDKLPTWHRLTSAPRHVSLTCLGSIARADRKGATGATLALVLVCLLSLFPINGLTLLFWSAMGCAISIAAARRMYLRHKLLRRGVLTLGTLESTSRDPNTAEFVQQLSFTTQEGHAHTHALQTSEEPAHTDEDALPMLYLPDEDGGQPTDVIALEELQMLGIGEDGEFAARSPSSLLYLVILAMHPVILLITILSQLIT